MHILMVLPRCSKGRMVRARHARALLLLFQHIHHPWVRQATSCQHHFPCCTGYTSPRKVGQHNVKNSIHGQQPTSISIPDAASAGADELAPLVVFPDVPIGCEELPTLGALAWRGSVQMDHQHRKHHSQGINPGFYSCDSLPCFIVTQLWDFFFLQKQPLVQTLLTLVCLPSLYNLVVVLLGLNKRSAKLYNVINKNILIKLKPLTK